MLSYKRVKPVVPQMNIGMNRIILSMMNASCCPV